MESGIYNILWLLAVVFVVALIAGLVAGFTRRVYSRRRFTGSCFDMRHLGFDGDKPIQQAAETIADRIPSFAYQLDKWDYYCFLGDDGLHHVAGYESDGQCSHYSVMHHPSSALTARIIGRIPNADKTGFGYLSILVPEHRDQVVHVACPTYHLYDRCDLPITADVHLAFFPYYVRTFLDQSDIERFRLYDADGPGRITGFSQGLFSMWEFAGRPINRGCNSAYVCGRVIGCTKRRNPVTRRWYYVVTLDIGGDARLDLVTRRRAFWRLPFRGDYIAAEGRLVGYPAAMTVDETAT